jgi:hypothetical protein
MTTGEQFKRKNKQQALHLKPVPRDVEYVLAIANGDEYKSELSKSEQQLLEEEVEQFLSKAFRGWDKVVSKAPIPSEEELDAKGQEAILNFNQRLSHAFRIEVLNFVELGKTGKPIHVSEPITIAKINWRGIIEIKHQEVLSAFNGIEAARIRQCPKCERIFWAGRIDMKGCSKKCSLSLRVQKHREAKRKKKKNKSED